MSSNNKITVTLTTVTGLHIGASKDVVEIGGIDSPVVKDPVTGYPYVPGSSIKGKMRSLIELGDTSPSYIEDLTKTLTKNRETAALNAKMKDKEKREKLKAGKPCECGDCQICRVFGSLNSVVGPTRLIVRDGYLDKTSIEKFQGLQNQGISPFEFKTETAIDRLTGSAGGTGSLRHIERVPPGFTFRFQIIYRGGLAKLVDPNQENEDKELILKALRLIQDDTLGGSGSRGYGQVELAISDWE
jgi:CRISPR-associated protein Csm3